MKPDVYKQLFEVMKTRRGPYTGMDIPEFYTLVQELFTPEQAQVNNVMPRKPVTAKDIAKDLDKLVDDIVTTLEKMADRGLCKTFRAFSRDSTRIFAQPARPALNGVHRRPWPWVTMMSRK
jgi:hypothetical protein